MKPRALSDEEVKDLALALLAGMRRSVPAEVLRDLAVLLAEHYWVPPALRPLAALLGR